MAVTVYKFYITTVWPLRRLALQAQLGRALGRRRYFETISSRRKDDAAKDDSSETLSVETMSAEDILKQPPQGLPISKELDKEFEEILKEFENPYQHVSQEFRDLPPFREIVPKKARAGAFNMGDDDADALEEDPEFNNDDITSIAHGQLEQHREYRHYARLAAWEMPLLTKMAKDFVPPTEKEVLRFRYTTYMGEQHPAEKKIVVEFCPSDMPDLTNVQQDKLRKLVGSRWNPETDTIKMSSEMYETQAQNKRYLGDLVETLLKEARDPTDTFEDIPLDTRHHQFKVKPKFPIEWCMTEERRAELEAIRERAELTDRQKDSQQSIVDGVQRIEAALRRSAKKKEMIAEPVMVGARKGAGKVIDKGKRARVR